MIRVAAIWRHPIKSHGSERLARVAVSEGRTLPWDRTWAVAHEAAVVDGAGWAPCVNFSRGAKSPALMAITAELDETTGRMRLRHPDLPDLDFDPERDESAFLKWVGPLISKDRAAPARIIRVPDRGMTDTPFPSVSLAGRASLRALSGRIGMPLDERRFRANFWIEGSAPWQEFEWIGREVAIGGARFRVEERIARCQATSANPETGRRDADTLGTLEAGWGHRDLGVYMVATASGVVAEGDTLEVLS